MKLRNDLWNFALQFYGQAGVETLCLKLQNDYELSINRLLLACWAGTVGKTLVLDNFSSPAEAWQREVTHLVRAARYRVRRAKVEQHELDGCYNALRQAELACEQVELSMLYASAESLEQNAFCLSNVEYNLGLYLQSADQPISCSLEEDLQALIRAVDDFMASKARG